MLCVRCDDLSKLRTKLPVLANEITNKEKFRDLYQFTFNFAKNPGQKGLGKLCVDMFPLDLLSMHISFGCHVTGLNQYAPVFIGRAFEHLQFRLKRFKKCLITWVTRCRSILISFAKMPFFLPTHALVKCFSWTKAWVGNQAREPYSEVEFDRGPTNFRTDSSEDIFFSLHPKFGTKFLIFRIVL